MLAYVIYLGTLHIIVTIKFLLGLSVVNMFRLVVRLAGKLGYLNPLGSEYWLGEDPLLSFTECVTVILCKRLSIFSPKADLDPVSGSRPEDKGSKDTIGDGKH